MADDNKYYVLKKKAVPEVLLKVVEAKRLIETGKAMSVQEAAEITGISRSSFYKYKDDIFPFHDDARGKTITFVLQMDDEPGLLSGLLKLIAEYNANILTIHQTIPVNEMATLTISIEVGPNTGDVSEMIDQIESKSGIHYLKILAREWDLHHNDMNLDGIAEACKQDPRPGSNGRDRSSGHESEA